MAEKYIRPEDVGPEDARIVLEFLNSAQSARQIAETIEIPGELDVGLRVAQRILDRRAALDGGFTALEQVAAVPYVGPERFTEIVSVLTGRLPPKDTSDADFQARVLIELQYLRSMVAAMQAGAAGPGLRVALRATLENGFVGQPVPLIVEVTDRASGQPRPNACLTVSAGWGNVQAFVGFEEKRGRAVTVYTDLKGKVELTFFPPTAETLTRGQQVALETALRELDPEARSPLDIMPQLEHMARRYQADNDKELRSAIDIYFSERQEQLTSAVNPGTAMGNWRCCHAPITAYLQEDHHGSSVQSMAVLNLCLKDWVRPWYAAYMALCERHSSLREDIDALGAEIQDSSELLDGILDSVYGFIGVQTGRVGEAVGQKIAQKAVNHFMASKLEALPLASRQTLLPVLSIAAKTIRSDTMGSLAVTTRIRKDIKADVAVQMTAFGDVGALWQKIDAIQKGIDQFQTDYSRFNTDYQSFARGYEAFIVDYSKFSNDISTFSTQFESFNTDAMNFNAQYNDFAEKQKIFSSNYSAFNNRYASLENTLTAFSSDYQKFRADYSKFREDFDTRTPIR
jgi:hypothetical protein